jgi:hypothetical protein
LLKKRLDRAAFAPPELGKPGNMDRSKVQGPGTWQFDAAISRIFPFRESQRLEFRAEAYNLTNSFRPQNSAVGITGNTFAQIRESREPRIMQFALKYVF